MPQQRPADSETAAGRRGPQRGNRSPTKKGCRESEKKYRTPKSAVFLIPQYPKPLFGFGPSGRVLPRSSGLLLLAVEETLDFVRRGFDEVVLLLDDLRDTRKTVDLGIHEIQNLFFKLFGLGLQRLFLGGPLLAPVVDHAFDLVAVEVHEGHQTALLFGDDRRCRHAN